MKINVIIRDAYTFEDTFAESEALKQFLAREHEFWSKAAENHGENPPRYFSKVSLLLSSAQLINQLEGEFAKEAKDQNQITTELQAQIDQLRGHWIWSKHPWVDALIDCSQNYPDAVYQAFIQLLPQQSEALDTNRYSNFVAALLAYEAITPESKIARSAEGEDKSLNRLRLDSQRNLKELTESNERFKAGFADWGSETQDQFYSAQNDREEAFKSFTAASEEKMKSLEETYEQHLKLSKPAEYWTEAAKKFGGQGDNWAKMTFGVTLVSLICLTVIFVTWLTGRTIGIELNTIQGIVMFGSILATTAFALRTLSRLTFSSYHLQRDAEERAQLTYLYLALVKESEVDKDNLPIVLQALFSRSESGLLANESGPTMPGDILRSASSLTR